MIEELEAYARESKVDDLFRDMMTGCFKTRPSSPATYILEYLASSHPEESLEHARAFVDLKDGILRESAKRNAPDTADCVIDTAVADVTTPCAKVEKKTPEEIVEAPLTMDANDESEHAEEQPEQEAFEPVEPVEDEGGEDIQEEQGSKTKGRDIVDESDRECEGDISFEQED